MFLQMAAEFFDDKLLSIGYAVFGVLETRNLTLDDFVFLEAITNIGKAIEPIDIVLEYASLSRLFVNITLSVLNSF